MAGMDVKDLVSYVLEEGHDLAGSDLAGTPMEVAACKGIAPNIRIDSLV
jgi:hypothetical protein